MEDTSIKGRAEKDLGRVGIDVAKELQGVGIGGVAAKNGARLQDNLVGAEILALEEDQLVFVRQVERPGGVLLQTEVERLDAGGRGIGAVVARGQQLRSPEARLGVENGLVADGDLGGNGVDIKLERLVDATGAKSWLDLRERLRQPRPGAVLAG